MNIFDPHITGSLSVSGSAEVSGDLTVLGTINATISGTTTNAISASHAARYLVTSSFEDFTSSYTTGAFTGSFIGDGANLYNIPASGVTGLNLNKIISGSVSASISPDRGFEVNTDATFTGSVNITGSIFLNGNPIGTGKLDETTFNTYTSSVTTYTGNTSNTIATLATTASVDLLSGAIATTVNNLSGAVATTDLNQNNRLNAIETATGSLNSFTSSINTTIKDKLNTETVISGSVQVMITGTTGYSTFSSSISSSIGALSSSVATTTLDLDNRIDSIETSTGSLNSFTSSINTTIKNKLNTETVVSGSAQVSITDTTGYSTFSSSIATTTNDLDGRVDTLEIESNAYATTGSNLFKGTQTLSGSIIPSVDNQYDLGSPDYQWRDVYISSGSLYIDGTKVLSSNTQELILTTDNGQSLKIIEGTTDSIVLQVADGDIELKSSGDGDILLDPTNGKIMLKGPVEVLSGQKIQSSVGGTPVVFANDIVVSGSIDLTGTIEGIDLTSFSSSLSSKIGAIETSTGSLNSFTSSAAGRLTAIETATSSLNSFTNSINTTIKSKLDSEGVVSGSSQIVLSGTTGFSTVSASLSSLSSSISITNLNQDGRLVSIEGKTGSYATTGSNNFVGDQTVTGSLVITQNLQVLGSSSFLFVTSSQLNVSSSTISVNVFEPAERFGGLKIFDSGSSSSTASFLWDSLNNRFIYQNVSGATYNGAMFIAGPRNTGSLGDEQTLTSGKIAKSTGGDHIGDSIISEVGGNMIAIGGGLVITGSILSTTTPLVSGSSQITYSGLTDTPSGIISGSAQVISSLPAGTVSGSSQVLNGSGIWSGSAQLPSGIISGAAQLPSGVVSGSSQVLNGSGIWSGSAQLPGGVVSGSSQIDLTGTTNYSTGIKTRLNSEGVISGSSQIDHNSTTNYDANKHIDHTAVSITAGDGLSGGGTIAATRTLTLDTGSAHFTGGVKSKMNADGVISGSSQVIYSGLTGTPSGIVSGSSQIIYSGLTSIPSGIVSGSAQVVYSGLTGTPSGIVSGSSQIAYSGLTGIPSGIVSGSAQIAYSGLTGIPSGIVSGSAQITLSSTTGFGTYLNQAVLTTSNPTFNSVIAADHRSTGTGYITYDTDNAGTNSLIVRKYSTTVVTFNASGNSVFAGTISASNFSGSSSGTNTGDQTNITGNAGTVTNGVYTTGDQTIGGVKTFSNKIVFASTVDNRPQFPGGMLGLDTGDSDFDIWGISRDYYPSHATSANAWGLRWYGTENQFRFVGAGTNRVIMDMDNGDITSTGTITAPTFSGSLSGNASSATTADQIDGVAFRNSNSGGAVAANTLDSNGITYVTDVDGSSSNLTGNSTDGALYSQAYNSSWQHQIYGDYRTGIMYTRGKNSGTWQTWKRVALSSATSFTNVSSVTFNHTLGTANVTAQVFDTNGDMFFPSNIRITSTQVILTFTTNRSGRLVVTG